MNPIDTDPIVSITKCKGLYARGKSPGQSEDTPEDHLTICNNAQFPGTGQVATRYGTSLLPNFSSVYIVAWFHCQLAGRDFVLYMDGRGNIYDGSILLGEFPGANDFTAVNVNNIVYLSPRTNGVAAIGHHYGTYYYTGMTGAGLQPAAPPGPGVGPTVAQSASAGVVTAGAHNVAVAFQTETGFITNPSPVNSVTQTDSLHQIDVSNIPTGPKNIKARILLMTKAGGTILWFVPGGTISDNTTTTAKINTADTGLVASADYLNNLISPLPACADLYIYKNRMILAGPENYNTNILSGATTSFGNLLYVSRVADFESIDKVVGILTVTADIITEPVRALAEIRDVLYIYKFTGTYSTIDNGLDPVNWIISVIDYGLGASGRGLSSFEMSTDGRDVYETIFIAHKNGLFLFTGVYSLITLTQKIDALWQTINTKAFYLVHIAHDIWRKQVWIAVPTGTNTFCDTIIHMDYVDGLDPDNVKFSLWNFPDTIGMMGMAFLTLVDNDYTLKWSCLNNAIFVKYDITQTLDYDGIAPQWRVQYPPLPTNSKGALSVFNGINFRAVGPGQIAITVSTPDFNYNVVLNSITITGLGDLFRAITGFVSEKMIITLYNASGTVQLYRTDVFAVATTRMRPSI
jgi:hypothetical protein